MHRFASRLFLALAIIATLAAPALAGAPTEALSASIDKVIALLADPAY